MMLSCMANCTSLVSSQGKTLSLELSLLETTFLMSQVRYAKLHHCAISFSRDFVVTH